VTETAREFYIMEKAYHVWSPIEDLPDGCMELANTDFHKFAESWPDVRSGIEGPAFDGFVERLNREWAIELGQVENLYSFDEETARALVEGGLQSVELPDQNAGFDIVAPALFLQSHSDIIDGIYEDARLGTPFNRYMIRCMHMTLTEFQDFSPGMDYSGRRGRVPLRKGQFKIRPNSPARPDGLVHQYCPPDQTDSEIDRLMRMHDSHVARKVPVDVEAAWFHHRFIQIHPFQDGNGRVARALASLIYVKGGHLPPVVKASGRSGYIEALDCADRGDLKVFVDYLASLVLKSAARCVRLCREAGNSP
jgi:fido (protein-threonine AMPylation protein)